MNLQTYLPMATLQQNQQPSLLINENDDDFHNDFHNDFVMVEKSQMHATEIIRCIIPVTNDKKDCSWRFECTRLGSNLRISAVSEVKLTDGLSESHRFVDEMQKIEIFQMKTFFGTPKMSLSSRNAFKYSIPIDSWYIDRDTNNTCFKTPILLIQGQRVIYEFSVMGENYENTSDHLRILLNKHFEHKYGARDDLGPLEFIPPRVANLLKQANQRNLNFIEKLFSEQLYC